MRLEEIRNILHQLRQEDSRRATYAVSEYGMAISFIIGFALNISGSSSHVRQNILLIFFACCGVRLCLKIVQMLGSTLPGNLEQRLNAINNPNAVGPLLEVLDVTHDKLRKVCCNVLVRLLEGLKYADRTLLNNQQRTILYRLVASSYTDSDLLSAILTALKHIGDNEAIPFVTRLAESTSDVCMRHHAQICLSCLQAKVEQKRMAQTLLRASAPSVSGADVLLRPASSEPFTTPEQLLRAGNADDMVSE